MFSKLFSRIRRKECTYPVSKYGNMISSSDRKPIIKMTGYLEKKSKMRVVCRWKKLWFVLEGRLLLYYKSQLEYLSLSPCRGTVNLGLAASVVPGKSNEIIVSTRSHTVALRALNRTDHDVWLQALIDAMCLPNSSHTICCTKPVHHFRYSTGVLEESERMLERVQRLGGHAQTLTARLGNSFSQNFNKDLYNGSNKHSTLLPRLEKNVEIENECYRGRSLTRDFVNTSPKSNGLRSRHNSISDYGMDKLSKKFSKIAVSDTSIPGKFRLTSNETEKSEVLRRSASVENDFVRFTENIYESVKEVELDIKDVIPKKRKLIDTIKRSDSDRILTRKNTIQREFRSEQRIKTSCDDSPLFRNKREKIGFSYNLRKSRDTLGGSNATFHDNRFDEYKLNGKTSTPRVNDSNLKRFHADIKSDTDLSIKKRPFRQSGSCDAITINRIQEMEPTKSRDEFPRFSEELSKFRAKMLKDSEIMNTANSGNVKSTKPRRTNSLLRRFSRESSRESYDSGVESGSTPKKRSLSFLKKMWKRKERKWETEDESFSTNPNPLFEINGSDFHIEELGNYSGIDLSMTYELPQPEPPPDYDEVHVSEDVAEIEPPKLPPRRHMTEEKRAVSPWHDIPTNNQPVAEESPPALPVKLRNRQQLNNNFDFIFHEDKRDDKSGLKCLFSDGKDPRNADKKKSNNDLGEMLAKLQEINKSQLQNYHYFMDNQSLLSNLSKTGENEPDYDVPRPHTSLLATLRKQSRTSDSSPTNNFFSTYDDSLDPQPLRDDFERLTMAPDSLECDPWSLSNDTDVQTETWAKYAVTMPLDPSVGYTQDSLYQDSLNATISNTRDGCIPYQKGFLKLYS